MKDSRERAGKRMRLRAELTPQAGPRVHGEVHQDGDRLIGTFFLPGLRPAELKYHIGRRTITVWSRKEGHEFQSILVLPRWVRPPTFILCHKNGVYEFLLETEPGRALPA